MDNNLNIFIVICNNCKNQISRYLKEENLPIESNKAYLIDLHLLLKIKSSEKIKIDQFKENEYYTYNNIYCLDCNERLGIYIISATNGMIDIIDKVKLKLKKCSL